MRKTWSDTKSQKGAYKILENAKKCADENPGYCVFDNEGVKVYASKATGPEPGKKTSDVPFLVKVSIDNLNIRSGPGIGHGRTGYFTGRGIFTIVEVKVGDGSVSGWGRLKSGVGWIALEHCTRI